MAGVKSPGPSMERRRDTLQADLGCLCCVFPGACEVAFLLENQGGLEKLVHHESLRQKTCYPNQETRAKQCHNDHVCDCTCKTSESRILYQQAGIWIDNWVQAGSSVRPGGQLINMKKTVLCNNCKRWAAGRWTTNL